MCSHTRTVVRECCKVDDDSLWERGKFEPPPKKKTFDRWSPQFVKVTTTGISTTKQDFIQIGPRGFGFAHVWFRAPGHSDSAFWFLRKATAETRAPILTQKNTSIDAVPRKEVSFGGRETKT